MKRKLFDMQYYNTYYFANMIEYFLENYFSFLREFESFSLYPERFLASFPKYSALHQFIEQCLDFYFFEGRKVIRLESIRKSSSKEIWIDQAFKIYGVAHDSFGDWLATKEKTLETASEDDLDEYYQEYVEAGTFEELQVKIVEEVFFIMFLNREFLREFNELIARLIIKDMMAEDFDETSQESYDSAFDDEESLLNNLQKDGVLKRVSIPRWVEKAVFYRDRGICVLCQRDLTGLINIHEGLIHYDHIVPLSLSGMNDVTNIQLLCADCNLKKAGNSTGTSKKYEQWF